MCKTNKCFSGLWFTSNASYQFNDMFASSFSPRVNNTHGTTFRALKVTSQVANNGGGVCGLWLVLWVRPATTAASHSQTDWSARRDGSVVVDISKCRDDDTRTPAAYTESSLNAERQWLGWWRREVMNVLSCACRLRAPAADVWTFNLGLTPSAPCIQAHARRSVLVCVRNAIQVTGAKWK